MSYQQARSYTIKYESGGVEALRDKHGKQKTPSKMSELGKLRAEMKILRGEKEPAEMEASFLKTRRNSKEAGLGSVRYDPYTMQSKKNVRSIIILSMHYAGLGAFQEPHTINGRTDRVWQINEKTRKLPR